MSKKFKNDVVEGLKIWVRFADGSYMQPDVMEATARELLGMPSPLITFEIQGGEPLCHLIRYEAVHRDLRGDEQKVQQARTVVLQ